MPDLCLHSAAVVARRTAAREETMRQEKQRLAAHREATINDVLATLQQRKCEWEAARAARVMALTAMQAEALSRLGEAQKKAANAEINERNSAKESAKTWKSFAEGALYRQRVALAKQATARASGAGAVSLERAVFRREVSKAAARHSRHLARTSQLNSDASQQGGARSRSRSSTRSGRSGSRSRRGSPRASEFSGPDGVGFTDRRIAADKSVVTSSLNRTPQCGLPSSTSVVRHPTVVIKSDMEMARSLSPGARAMAQRHADDLLKKRREAGELQVRRASDASSRGQMAGSKLRLSREGMYLLEEMQKLDAASKVDNVLQSNAISRRRSKSPGSGSLAAPIGVASGPGGLPLQQGIVVPSVHARDPYGTVRLAPQIQSNAAADEVRRLYATLPAGVTSSTITEGRFLTSAGRAAADDDDVDDEDVPKPRRYMPGMGMSMSTVSARSEDSLRRAFEDAFLGTGQVSSPK